MKSKHKKEHLTAIAEAIKSALLDANDELANFEDEIVKINKIYNKKITDQKSKIASFEKQIELLEKGLS